MSFPVAIKEQRNLIPSGVYCYLFFTFVLLLFSLLNTSDTRTRTFTHPPPSDYRTGSTKAPPPSGQRSNEAAKPHFALRMY